MKKKIAVKKAVVKIGKGIVKGAKLIGQTSKAFVRNATGKDIKKKKK